MENLTIELSKMTFTQKFELFQFLWEELLKTHKDIPTPDWHIDILDDRLNKVNENSVDFQDWNNVKKSLKDKF